MVTLPLAKTHIVDLLSHLPVPPVALVSCYCYSTTLAHQDALDRPLALVEWIYLDLLDGYHQEVRPRALFRRLAAEPRFFCEVVNLAYPLAQDLPVKTERERNKRAFKLLWDWKTPPGVQIDGSFDGNYVTRWLNEVKSQFNESEQQSRALRAAGGVLIYVPPDPTGLWIDHSVASLLDSADEEQLRAGYMHGLFRSQGIQPIEDTGELDRKLAARYRSKADDLESVGYYRLADLLEEVARDYENG